MQAKLISQSRTRAHGSCGFRTKHLSSFWLVSRRSGKRLCRKRTRTEPWSAMRAWNSLPALRRHGCPCHDFFHRRARLFLWRDLKAFRDLKLQALRFCLPDHRAKLLALWGRLALKSMSIQQCLCKSRLVALKFRLPWK